MDIGDVLFSLNVLGFFNYMDRCYDNIDLGNVMGDSTAVPTRLYKEW